LAYNGRKIVVNEQPFQVLLALLERPGELVTREELIHRLWPDGTFVDYERGLNKAVNKLRDILRDSADSPRFVETIPRRGYRFIAPVEGRNTQISAGNVAVPAQEVPSSVARRLIVEFTRRMFPLSVLGVILLLLLTVGLGVYMWRTARGFRLNLQKMQITKVTDSGTAANVAISPDGRYVVYVLSDGEKQSLWARLVATESTVQILPAETVAIDGLTISPDGNYLYFLRSQKSSFNMFSLYQMPILGGAPRLLIQDIDTPITFSPDGQRIAFIQGDPPKGESYLVTADIKGGNRKVLATRKHPQSFTFANFSLDKMGGYLGPAWSPDGKTIVASASEGMRGRFSVLAISVSDGKVREVYSSNNLIGRLQWVPGGDGVLVVIANPVTGMGGQVWYVSYPQGKAQRLTNDLTNYDPCCIDLAKNAETIATVENNYVADLFIAPAGLADKLRQITSRGSIVDATWLTDDKIIAQNTKGDLLTVGVNGGTQTRLTPDAHNIRGAAACGDGRHIVFESLRTSNNVWKMEADGSNPAQLTDGNGELLPDCSPDGKWLVYQSLDKSAGFTLWRVDIDGSRPTQLTHQWAYGPRISPDGKLVAYSALGSQFAEPDVMVVVESVSGQQMYSWSVPPDSADFRWAPDGQALDYVITRGAISNLWRQRLKGGPAEQITNFKSGRIFSFGWSRDGEQLLVVRGDISSDVILIKDFR